MDELESRLSDGLARHAAGLPEYQGDVRKVARRGRNRRWAARGAGAVGALAILGGGAVIYQAANGGDVVNVATQTPPVVVPTETPTPTPEPTPEEAIVPDEATTPDPTPTPAVETVVRDVFAVAANGWGVGLVGTGGDLFATLACCDQDGEDWRAQPLTESARGALRVRDDLRGGLVVSTEDTLWLQAAASFGTDTDPIVVDREPLRETNTVSLELWDVSLIDDTVSVLYSVSVSDALGEAGRDELRRADIVPDTKPVIATIDTSTWSPDTPGFIRRGAAWVPGGGHMELRQAIGGDGPACEWVEYVDTDPAFDSPFDPPTPDGECPQDSIGAAAMNAEGQLAVIERFLAQPPLTAELVVYDRVGNELYREPLPETGEDDPRWTELDIVGSAVLVSRAVLDTDPASDSVLRFDLGATVSPRELAFVGNPTFARSNLVTGGLTPLDPADARWFGDPSAAPQPTPDPDDPDQPEETTDTPEATPEPTPDSVEETPPGLLPEELPPEVRTPIGRGGEPLTSGKVRGDDGCIDEVCLGMSTDPGEALSVLVGPGRRVELTETDGIVTSILVLPSEDGPEPGSSGAGIDLPPFPALKVHELLRNHGAPVEVRNEIGVDPDGTELHTVWLIYEIDNAEIAYGLTATDPTASILLEPGDERVPERYDGLMLNSYRAKTLD